MENSMLLRKIVVMTTLMKLETGLRIGGTKEEVRIGDIDHPVIRDPITKRPYIPGSSLKGKMRSVLEIALNGVQEPCFCGECVVCKLFGAGSKAGAEKKEVSRLIVRDCYMTEESQELLLNFVGDYVEIKTENVVNRVTGVAEHPRTLDRIPAGTEFKCEFVLRLYEKDLEHEENFIKNIKMALKLIEFTYLGGCGTRGYGKVKFSDVEFKRYDIKVTDDFVEISESKVDKIKL
ncbi:CRISPR-associated RAMP protein, Csm3 family [Caldicellulosiruptor owensensis OL]|uniref:CRISPR system Cms endoribonuclease Csm3 n=1 Tax=Caldicellulosiruptor owensensis (strain ATCC 700167 / DSM 13100 / OL) TaxID=632518 RepID=E4Q734_CALOW|nr:type III-A CRISPR-associated RAMP protein Csm3 [Caldicellulosiruptor owensensis]ADQ05714.1 CRISPR-associated RAMP protein, Csm3 family [Caldicellulosiruptor owensensis OL]